MWTPLITHIALVLLTAAAGAATAVALTTTDHQRAVRALTLLKSCSVPSSAAAVCSPR
ncbi:hypothetical protein ACGFMK_35670 [Amycolatopsis sp. NPDC049252]|uniref:hypothetical protein n=1 Tax=Amycolatopsis sp. NPDC049252 TaxID=3363933 RepID=UPI0037129BE5